jgi:hypothetical protein
MAFDVDSFLRRLKERAKKNGAGKLVDTTIAGLILAKANPEAFGDGLRLLAVIHGKPAVKATVTALVEELME